jgi:hypothetical protein
VTRDLSIDVPGYTPLGTYIITLEAEALSGEVLDEDSFRMKVLGSGRAKPPRDQTQGGLDMLVFTP